MATTKKKTKQAPAKKPKKLTNATLMRFEYHPEAKLLRANVQQDVVVMGADERVAQDRDFTLEDLPDDIMEKIDRLFERIAEHVDATAYEPD